MVGTIKLLFGGCLFVWLLTVGSCAMMGWGTVAMIDAVGNSKTAKKVVKNVRKMELDAHNERANRESAYRDRNKYVSDYNSDYN
jgi:hypothetical protein